MKPTRVVLSVLDVASVAPRRSAIEGGPGVRAEDLKQRCQFRVVPGVVPRPANALCVEAGAWPEPRCTLKLPEHVKSRMTPAQLAASTTAAGLHAPRTMTALGKGVAERAVANLRGETSPEEPRR